MSEGVFLEACYPFWLSARHLRWVDLASLSELFETDALHTTMVAIGPDVVPAARHDLTVNPKKTVPRPGNQITRSLMCLRKTYGAGNLLFKKM
jgi:hypothetical protein